MTECKQCLNEKQGLQRQIEALQNLLKEKGVLLNDESVSKAEYEWSQSSNIGCLQCGRDLKDCECHPEVEDDYNYYQDDLNYDAERERRLR